MASRLRRTKIVVTLGPATDSTATLRQVIQAGANVVRLNFSHGSAAEQLRRAEQVRQVASELNLQVAILGDLQGPKIRISSFTDGQIRLQNGDNFILDAELAPGAGCQQRVGIDYKALVDDLRPGDTLLLDDGRVQLVVNQIEGQQIKTQVSVGGTLSNHKGINKLGGGLSAPALTEKDRHDIKLAAQIGVDYLAVSFPRTAADLNLARELAQQAGCRAQIVAKVERADAVATAEIMDEIILASDVVMVARGDLGVEIGDAQLVGVQKSLIRRARQLNRCSITATQMMESMISQSMPTRAEVMDVANAVLDGSDAVMLSAETATGNYPVATVAAMADVCLGAEKVSLPVYASPLEFQFDNTEEAIAMSAMAAANHLSGVEAIITLTESGRTALLTSRISSGLPIFALSRHPETLRRTALYRGVTPVAFKGYEDGLLAAHDAMARLRDLGYLRPGDRVIVTQGDVMGASGTTNTLRVLVVE